MQLSEKIDAAEKNLERKLDWVERHDTRIAFTAGGTLAMLGVLATASATVTQWSCFLYFIFGTTALLLCISLFLVYLSQYPNVNSPKSSLLFFETISDLPLDTFKNQFRTRTSEEYLDDLLCQIHTNARILSRKFKYLKGAFILLGISVLPWLIALYYSKLYLK